jgi:hypothetical protein
MRTFLLFIILSLSLVSFGQQNSNPKPFKEWQPLYYLDSVNVEFSELHFDPEKIESMNVVKSYIDSIGQNHGKIFITSKDPKDYNFLTISDITKTYKKDTLSPTVFMLDNEFLKDITKFKIDSNYILNVELLRGSEFDYLKKIIPNLTILKIITRTKENLANQNHIYIR